MPSKDFTAAKTVVARNARGQVTGNKELKGGQQYPEGFGQAVADLYTRARTEKHPHSDTNPLEELTIFPENIYRIMALGPMPNSMSWPTIANCL
jgi:hypothetical protein